MEEREDSGEARSGAGQLAAAHEHGRHLCPGGRAVGAEQVIAHAVDHALHGQFV